MKNGYRNQKERSLLAYESVHWIVALGFTGIAALSAGSFGSTWFESALITATGALAGYLTTDIAITMLLWPTQPKLGGRLHGVFFKRRDVFGNALIDRSSAKFLNPELFNKLIQDPAVEEALKSSVRDAVIQIASSGLGTPRLFLSEFLPHSEEREELFDRVAAGIGNQAARIVYENGSEENVFRLLDKTVDYVGHLRPYWLADSHEVAITLEDLLSGCLNEDSIDFFRVWAVKRFSESLHSTRLIGKFLPEDIRQGIKQIGRGYVADVILKEIDTALSENSARTKIANLVATEAENLFRLKLDEIDGLKGWAIRTLGKKDIDELMSGLPGEMDSFLQRIPKLIRQTEFRQYVEQAVERGIEYLLNLQLRDLRVLMPENFVDNLVTAGVDLLRIEKVRKELSASLAQFLCTFADQEFGNIAPSVFGQGKTRVKILQLTAKEISEVLSDPETRKKMSLQSRILTRRLVVSFLDTPLPRIIDLPFVKPRGVDSIAETASQIVSGKLREFAPKLVERFPIRERLMDLWEAMSNEEIHDSIQGVMEDQFKILINLGISFGAVVGLLSVVLQGISGTVLTTCIWALLIIAYRIFKFKEVDKRLGSVMDDDNE